MITQISELKTGDRVFYRDGSWLMILLNTGISNPDIMIGESMGNGINSYYPIYDRFESITELVDYAGKGTMYIVRPKLDYFFETRLIHGEVIWKPSDEIEVTVLVNGVEKHPSMISETTWENLRKK